VRPLSTKGEAMASFLPSHRILIMEGVIAHIQVPTGTDAGRAYSVDTVTTRVLKLDAGEDSPR